MSTPTTAGQQPPHQPGSASKKTAGHVTTPSHLGVGSPAPRSVPSPAATRKDHAAKTPVNHPTASSTGSKTLGSTPMVHNLSQTGLTVSSSPGAQNASFGTPSGMAGLGVDLGSTTPGQLSSLLAGGAAMMPTMSELGLTSRNGKKNEDEERREKMRKVLKNIGRRKGRVSQDGITRVGRRVGLDIDLDNESAAERARNVGNRTIAIAGLKVLIEVTLKHHVAQKVDVMVDGDGVELPEFQEPAGALLLKDLKVPDSILLHSNLDRFARNLNRLARLDILTKTTSVNCFRAIHGLYKSFEKLYNLEKESIKAQQEGEAEDDDALAENEVMRRRSGRPTVHGKGRLGLALEYWAIGRPRTSQKDSSAMEVDGQEEVDASEHEQPDVYRLQIEAESSPAPMHAALRVSDEWLPETFEIPAPESGEQVPWQEPPPTYVTDAGADVNALAMDGGQRVPDLRFVAKLDPPVVLPWNMINLLSEIGIELPSIGQVPDYYDALLNVDVPPSLTARTEPVTVEQNVLALRQGQEADVTHQYVLDISRPEHGYKMEKLYFSHPRQLVSLLPVLRQWAQVGAVVHSAFGTSPTTKKLAPAVNGNPVNILSNGVDAMDLDETRVDTPADKEDDKLPVSVGLSALPQPTLSVMFPPPTTSEASELCNVIVQVMPNATLAVTSCTGLGGSTDLDQEQERAKKLARTLDVCGDLGLWVEWVRENMVAK